MYLFAKIEIETILSNDNDSDTNSKDNANDQTPMKLLKCITDKYERII